jgi:hypothetical protein
MPLESGTRSEIHRLVNPSVMRQSNLSTGAISHAARSALCATAVPEESRIFATAVLILAVGIAFSLALFEFVDAALIRPLPYANLAH